VCDFSRKARAGLQDGDDIGELNAPDRCSTTGRQRSPSCLSQRPNLKSNHRKFHRHVHFAFQTCVRGDREWDGIRLSSLRLQAWLAKQSDAWNVVEPAVVT
jgi:hypothetical protein